MSKDISTMYTKDLNKTKGRNGYFMVHREKVNVISPSRYGMFLFLIHKINLMLITLMVLRPIIELKI